MSHVRDRATFTMELARNCWIEVNRLEGNLIAVYLALVQVVTRNARRMEEGEATS